MVLSFGCTFTPGKVLSTINMVSAFFISPCRSLTLVCTKTRSKRASDAFATNDFVPNEENCLLGSANQI